MLFIVGALNLVTAEQGLSAEKLSKENEVKNMQAEGLAEPHFILIHRQRLGSYKQSIPRFGCN